MSGLVHALTMRSPTALPVVMRGQQCGGQDRGQAIVSTAGLFDRLGCVPGDAVIVLQRKGEDAWEVCFGRASLQAVTEETNQTLPHTPGGSFRESSDARSAAMPEVWTSSWVTQSLEGSDASTLSSWLSSEHDSWIVSIASIARTQCARVDLAQKTPEPILPPEACHAACYGWVVAPHAKIRLPSVPDPIEISGCVPSRPPFVFHGASPSPH